MAHLHGQSGGKTAIGTATSSDILSGITATVPGGLITGTIPSKSTQTYTPSTANQTITAGQYLSGNQVILGDTDLIAANIKSGVNIFGVAGTIVTGLNAQSTWRHGNGTTSVIDIGAAKLVSVYATCENGSMLVQASSNGSTWVDVAAGASSGSNDGGNFSTPGIIQFHDVAIYRYYRLYFANYNNGNIMNAMLSVTY